MRVPASGQNDEALATMGTDVRELISGLDPDGDGMTFYLTQIQLTNRHASQVGAVFLADSNESTSLTTGDALIRGSLIVPANDTVVLTYEDGEKPFVTNLVAGIVNGTFGIGDVNASGYLA